MVRADDEMRNFLIDALEYLGSVAEGNIGVPVAFIRAMNDVERLAQIEESVLPPEKQDVVGLEVRAETNTRRNYERLLSPPVHTTETPPICPRTAPPSDPRRTKTLVALAQPPTEWPQDAHVLCIAPVGRLASPPASNRMLHRK